MQQLLSSPGAKVIGAMYNRYSAHWFRTMSLVQTTTQRRPDGATSTTTWYQSVSLPGKLRIDIGDPKLGNGALYTADSVYRLREGKVIFSANRGNELMPLMFDVFVLPVERTLASLRSTGFNLNIVHLDYWHGRPVFVVGAPSDNLSIPQFWIDRERLVLLRQIQPVAPGDGRLLDIQLSRYQQADSSWIASVVEIYMNGVLTQHEVYSNIKLNVPLDSALFDVTKWREAKHWVTGDSLAPPTPPIQPARKTLPAKPASALHHRYNDDSAVSNSSRSLQ